jgi:hypothetical protein
MPLLYQSMCRIRIHEFTGVVESPVRDSDVTTSQCRRWPADRTLLRDMLT